MPKPTKLHAKGKSNTLQKPCKVDQTAMDGADLEESVRQFQLELCWCIQQLERTLNEKKGNEKQLQEAWKLLTVLKNNNQPMIRKRQIMRTHFGDYRAKMAAEEKKLVKMTSKIKISEVQEKPKATFLRKSAFLTTGNDSFRFNFNLSSDQADGGDSSVIPGNTTVIPGNTTVNEVENTKTQTEVPENEDNSKNFKFLFSDSSFKFNFDVDNS